MKETFTCADCGETKPVNSEGATGYAVRSGSGAKICYDCCAVRDRAEMAASGNSRALPLYLTGGDSSRPIGTDPYMLTNWPGTLRFRVRAYYRTRHNWGGWKTHVWFRGPDENGENKAYWYGFQGGESNQVAHCRRLKRKPREW